MNRFWRAYDDTTHFSGIPTVRSDVVVGDFVVPFPFVVRGKCLVVGMTLERKCSGFRKIGREWVEGILLRVRKSAFKFFIC